MKKFIIFTLTGLMLILIAYLAISFMRNKLAYEDALQKVNYIKDATTCESIPDHVYETGLIFNPSDYQTYYFKSECYQTLAIRTGDKGHCSQVKERKSLFFDGSAVSYRGCMARVEK